MPSPPSPSFMIGCSSLGTIVDAGVSAVVGADSSACANGVAFQASLCKAVWGQISKSKRNPRRHRGGLWRILWRWNASCAGARTGAPTWASRLGSSGTPATQAASSGLHLPLVGIMARTLCTLSSVSATHRSAASHAVPRYLARSQCSSPSAWNWGPRPWRHHLLGELRMQRLPGSASQSSVRSHAVLAHGSPCDQSDQVTSQSNDVHAFDTAPIRRLNVHSKPGAARRGPRR